MNREIDIPAGRSRRLLHLGKLAGGIAGGAVAEGFRRIGSGRGASDNAGLLLTPANARRLTRGLSEMRGAAMKVGQLLSMEAGDFLPSEFTQVLAQLRDNAHAMPMLQVAGQLERAWGAGWEARFERFGFTPVAAASIGQVHRATTRDGRELAIKIQYPGVRQSIDSDVDNVAALLRFFRLVPDSGASAPLLQEAKHQLHKEADYRSEARYISAYGERLDGLNGFRMPVVDAELTGDSVLAMTYLDGQPIDSLDGAGIGIRNEVASRLVALFLRESLDWGLVQTDPNFSNYRYLPESGAIGLLDFGATRSYPPERTEQFRRLMKAAIRGERASLMECAEAVGYLGEGDPDVYRSTVIALLKAAAEPARAVGGYAFAGSNLARRMSEQVLRLRVENRVWRMPPADVLFLHRKLGGLYLLCTRLNASVNVRELVEPYL